MIFTCRSRFGIVGFELRNRLRQHLIQTFLPRALIGDEDRFTDRPGHQFTHLRRQRRINGLLRHHSLWFAGQPAQLLDLRHDFLDFAVRQFDCFQHGGFGQLVRPGFDHHHRIRRSGHHEMEFAGLQHLQVRIHHELPVDTSDLDACNRAVERELTRSPTPRRPQ